MFFLVNAHQKMYLMISNSQSEIWLQCKVSFGLGESRQHQSMCANEANTLVPLCVSTSIWSKVTDKKRLLTWDDLNGFGSGQWQTATVTTNSLIVILTKFVISDEYNGNEKHFNIHPVSLNREVTKWRNLVSQTSKIWDTQAIDKDGLITICEDQVTPSITSLGHDDKLAQMHLELRSLNMGWWPDLRRTDIFKNVRDLWDNVCVKFDGVTQRCFSAIYEKPFENGWRQFHPVSARADV